MSSLESITPIDNVCILPVCSPELHSQLAAFLGEDYSIRPLMRLLAKRKMSNEAKGAIRSFVPDLDVLNAQRAVWDVDFIARCDVDTDPTSEVADYREITTFQVDGSNNGHRPTVALRLSPNSLRAVYEPVRAIMDETDFASLWPNEKIRDTALAAACRGIYSNVLTQFMVERHLFKSLGQKPNEAQLVRTRELVDDQYRNAFPAGELPEASIRLHRLAACLGGAVMLRQIAWSIEEHDFGVNSVAAGTYLRGYGLGLQQKGPTDEQQISFSIAHAFIPIKAAGFMRAWFGNPS